MAQMKVMPSLILILPLLLATQVKSPVLWENSLENILAEGRGFKRAVELGPGKVTAGILKCMSKTPECLNVKV